MRRRVGRACAAAGLASLAALVLAAPAGAKTKTKTLSNATPVSIPDATPGINGLPGAVFDDIGVGKKGIIKDVKVGVQIAHPDTSDLQLWLFKDEQYIPLSFFVGGPTTANMGSGTGCTGGITVFDGAAPLSIFQGDNPFDGSFRPTQNSLPLGVYSGEQFKGAWRLLALDFAPPPPASIGTINCFQITVKYKPQ